MIVLKDIHKTYREGETRRDVLTGVSTVIERGEFVAIQGRSGSGKSTLLNIIAGLDQADSGTILLSGQFLGEMDETRRTLFRRRHIGFVFQFFNLIPTLSVAENLRFCMELNKMDAGSMDARVDELLGGIGLADRKHSYVDRLSGGEQQRVAIARAVAHLPEIVLADEPTGNLDATTESGILGLLQQLPAQHGVTLVIATHSDSVAKRADRALGLDDGKLMSE